MIERNNMSRNKEDIWLAELMRAAEEVPERVAKCGLTDYFSRSSKLETIPLEASLRTRFVPARHR